MGIMTKLPKVCIVGILAPLILAGCTGSDESVQSTESSMGGACELVIKFNGRSADKQFFVACQDSATVLTILEKAALEQMIEYTVRGTDSTALVTSIGGVKNEKSYGDNWVYRVNGKLGDRSAGIFQVNPGDMVQWTFGKYQPGE